MSKPLSLALLLALGLLVTPPLPAATVFQFTVTDFTDTPPAVDRSVLTVRGRDLRLDSGFRGGPTPGASTIYHGNMRSLTVLLHQTGQAMVFNARTGTRIAKFLEKTRKQWDQAISKLPEEEREAARRRLVQRYPGMGAEATASDQPIVLRKMTDVGTTNGFDWVRWEAVEGKTKVREYQVTGAARIPGGHQTVEVIADMSSYLQQLTRDLGGQIPMQNPFLEIAKLDGFPAVIRSFAAGSVERETVLDSAASEKVGADLFKNPGYQVLDPIELLGEMRP